MKVWIVRHGESETNRDGLWTGWLDVALTEKGKNDAAMAGEFLEKTRFDKIYSSDLSRAKATAEIAIPNCEYETDPMLREMYLGSIEGKPWSVIMDAQNQPMNRDGYAVFGGESYEAFSVRVSAFMKRLETLEYDNVAIFSHGGWLRGALDFVLGVKLMNERVCCRNCMVAIFDYDGARWKLHSWINLDLMERTNEKFETR